MKAIIVIGALLVGSVHAQQYEGQYSKNPYNTKSVTNPYSSNYNPTLGKNGSSAKLYDSQGNYRGKLSDNKYSADSISNPYGRYGSKYSADSVNNPYGAGSVYDNDSPNNPYGDGLEVYSDPFSETDSDDGW